MKHIAFLATVGIMVLVRSSVAAPANECMVKCRQELAGCQRAARTHARDCVTPCRESRASQLASCPPDATPQNCPALQEVRQCMANCRKSNQTDGRACVTAARQCQVACPKPTRDVPKAADPTR